MSDKKFNSAASTSNEEIETITYGNIMVSNFPFTTIQEVHISHKPNEHATVKVVGEISKEDGDNAIKRTDASTGVAVETAAKGQNKTLFIGCVHNISMQEGADYYILTVNLISTSSRLDIQRNNKTFQNTASTYEEILTSIMQGQAVLDFTVPDKPIESMIMQCNETNWEFTKRAASSFNAPVIPSITKDTPLISIGLPNSSKNYKMNSSSYNYSINHHAFEVMSKNYAAGGGNMMKEDFGEVQAASYIYGYIGDNVTFNGGSYRIKSIESTLKGGLLTNTYCLAGGGIPSSGMSTGSGGGSSTSGGGSVSGGRKGAAGGGSNTSTGGSSSASGGSSGGSGGSSSAAGGGAAAVGGFAQPVSKNAQASGRMMKGVVQAVEMDKVQVHFIDIDSSYDAGGSHWFPYSTAYSSSDGSGWYCMPEIGDTVRVFFPSDKEEDAFAASSVNVSPLDNPRYKSWKAPGGKEILLTDEGMFIICNKEKVFINLTDEDGISIYADKNITITSKGNVNIEAVDSLEIHAKNNIQIGTSDSYIDIRKEAITIGAEQVLVN